MCYTLFVICFFLLHSLPWVKECSWFNPIFWPTVSSVFCLALVIQHQRVAKFSEGSSLMLMYKLSWRPAKGRGSSWRKNLQCIIQPGCLLVIFGVSYFILSFPRYLQGLILCSFVQHYSFFYPKIHVLFLYPLLMSELFDSSTMYNTYLATQNDTFLYEWIGQGVMTWCISRKKPLICS